ncbi:TAF1 transcription initiation factor TFIID subunit TAF1 [Neolentinus lepideus HHB14362 ss-1]|uniref:TAF1 transcription initiation factor TFIID subunit TAF1 n=1 Tax=Neolentinus lepideus HHB14362 ss-1 TaxID=1314782 RepID=A0A165W688_9AGAM|nr:TAF1 transcription initiation factor TFIID subunit TAF1 [Neolentinus lepideus HHB14362 ss-1]
MSEETDVISALTGFSLDRVLSGLSLPSTSALSNQLGISGLPSLDSKQIYGDNWDGDGAVGVDQGEDFEDQVDRELEEEGDSVASVKMEAESPGSMPTQRHVRVVRRLVERPKTVYERFPTFEKDKILDFTELFKGYTVPKSRVSKRPFHVEPVYPRKREVPKNFLRSIVGDAERQAESQRADEVVAAGNIDYDLQNALEDRATSENIVSLSLQDRSFDLVLLANWEDQIVYEPDEDAEEAAAARPESKADLTSKVNKSLESGAWTQSIIWSPRAPFRDFTQLEINEEDVATEERPTAVDPRPRKRFRSEQVPKDKFNLSNDQYYELSKEGRGHRVRQTFGQLVVEHAYPAQKLQLPFYKTRLSKQEARSWHRPALQFPANVELHFGKVRTAKKKKDKAGRKVGKGGNVGEGLHRTTDLSLKDTSNYVLWEFSEEHPPIMSNFGMGSILVNYYRKKDEKDEHIPKYDLGVPFVLEPQDESPFMKFGYVYPGETVPALYNNLIRAPLFRQKPYPTDFLVVRSTIKGETRYYIREMKNLFVVGQTYPVTEVPGPHSRKITNTIKHRLQNITYKLLQKSHEERLKISRLMKYFPDQNELQMRQRLKEFMEYHRRGPHQGFWRLKQGWQVPSEVDQLKMVTPEQVVLSESMQVGQRHLQDLGYSQAAEAVDGDEGNLSIEQQLAPWITTKNFLFATQAKAMLRLHGEGDPSGRGEAFSFIRVSMKDIFVKAGEDYEQKLAEAEARPKSAHRYNVAEQQLIYKSEIERIWKAQFDSLSRRDEPQLTEEDERRDASQKPQEMSLQRRALDLLQLPAISALSPTAAGPSAAPSPAYSRGSSVDRDREMSYGPENSRRVLRIKRLVDGHWRTEIVRDPAVIHAYVRRRQMIEEETTLADALAPTGDAEKDARAKKRLEEEILRMKKNQERRLHRKNAKIAKEGGTPLLLNRPVKPDTTRRCGHCGQMGHMKTNRKCPRWAEFNSGAPPATPSAASPSAGSPPTPGLPTLGFNKSSDAVFSPTIGQASSRPGTSYGFPTAVPSPLATSPPLSAMNDADLPQPPAGSAPKIKLTLKKT